MRTWAYRHPNVIVIALVLADLVCLWDLVEHIQDHRWLMVTVQLTASCYLVGRIRDWWKRT